MKSQNNKKKGSILEFKKGNAVIDTVMVVVSILGFALMMMVGKSLFTELNTDIQNEADMNVDAKADVSSYNSRYGGIMDGLFLTFFLLLWGLVLVASYMLNSHPVFFVFTVILLVFVFVIAGFMGDAYEELTEDPDLSAGTTAMPITDWILSHYITVAIVIGFSICLVLFGKQRGAI